MPTTDCRKCEGLVVYKTTHSNEHSHCNIINMNLDELNLNFGCKFHVPLGGNISINRILAECKGTVVKNKVLQKKLKSLRKTERQAYDSIKAYGNTGVLMHSLDKHAIGTIGKLKRIGLVEQFYASVKCYGMNNGRLTYIHKDKKAVRIVC